MLEFCTVGIQIIAWSLDKESKLQHLEIDLP